MLAIILFLAAQFITLIGAILTSHIKSKMNFAELKTQTSHLLVAVDSLKTDHGSLSDKVDGVSRHVAIIEGMEKERAAERKRA